ESFTDLGITFDSKLCFNKHIDNITNKAFKNLGFIIRTCTHFNNLNAFKNLYFAFVRFQLEYASLIWSSNNIEVNQILDAVQNRFLRFLAFKFKIERPQHSDYNGVLFYFNIQLLNTRRFEDTIEFQKTYIHGEKYTSNNDSEHESEDNSDSDRNEDNGEYMYVHKHKNLGTLLHMLQVCHKTGLKNVFLCLYDALHIACTLPNASITPERTFSKLKILKNRLRTTISQDRLEQQLLLMS
ncbi:zinc finger MYM-type protein 1-like, partial [Aphis craccivora]